jgi:hypothetical protein
MDCFCRGVVGYCFAGQGEGRSDTCGVLEDIRGMQGGFGAVAGYCCVERDKGRSDMCTGGLRHVASEH